MKIVAVYEEFEDGSAATFKFELKSDFVPRVGDFIYLKGGAASMRENEDGSRRRYWHFVVETVSITVDESGKAESICITVRPIENV